MNFSNKVKEFEPYFITDTSLWKYCDEYYVMAALMYFYPNKYFHLTHSDRRRSNKLFGRIV